MSLRVSPDQVPYNVIFRLTLHLKSKGHPLLSASEAYGFLRARLYQQQHWRYVQSAAIKREDGSRFISRQLPTLEEYVRVIFSKPRDEWIVERCQPINVDVTAWLDRHGWLLEGQSRDPVVVAGETWISITTMSSRRSPRMVVSKWMLYSFNCSSTFILIELLLLNSQHNQVPTLQTSITFQKSVGYCYYFHI